MADEQKMDESEQSRTKRRPAQQRVPLTPEKKEGVQPVTKEAPGSGPGPGAGDERARRKTAPLLDDDDGPPDPPQLQPGRPLTAPVQSRVEEVPATTRQPLDASQTSRCDPSDIEAVRALLEPTVPVQSRVEEFPDVTRRLSGASIGRIRFGSVHDVRDVRDVVRDDEDAKARRPLWSSLDLGAPAAGTGLRAARAFQARVAEEDDLEEEPDRRQKLRINATQRIAYLEKYGELGHLLVSLDENTGDDGPALALVSTRTTLVTFLDAAGNEMDTDDVRRPFPSKIVPNRTKLVKCLRRLAASHDVVTPLAESDIKATVIKWENFDATNVLNIRVEDAPVMDISYDAFLRLGGPGGSWERENVRKWLLDLRARRERDHKETLGPPKPTHHLAKGFDDLYNAETNSFRFGQDEWLNGSGRRSVWKAVSKKIREVDALRNPHVNTLASANVDRETRPPDRFYDQKFAEVFSQGRSIDGLVGEKTDEEPGSYVSLSALPGMEGVLGYVSGETGRVYYFFRFQVPNCGEVSSDVFFNTKEEARDARSRAIDNYDFPAGRLDAGQIEAIKRGYALAPGLYDLVCKKLAPDPREVPRLAPSQRYTEPDSEGLWFHLTAAGNFRSIMANGLRCRALEDVLGSGKTHSRLPAAIWGSPNVEQCERHGLSPDTIDRHVSNGLTTYATWNKVALIAIRMEGSGWHKISMPDYKQSGCTYQDVAAFDGRLFDLAKEGNLAAMREWAASLRV
jgi:hypothetical protein